ncbi:MAG TPA: acyltransferase [Vicinamibacterales bacterium]
MGPQQDSVANPNHQVSGERFEWLDCLRGLSALAIVLFHVRVTLWIGARAVVSGPEYGWVDRAAAWMTLPFPVLGSTVMLFFVVSGFAIHYPNAASDTRLALGGYALRRCLRIWPAYLVAVVLTVVAEHVAAGVTGIAPSPPQKAQTTAAMLQNYISPVGQLSGNPSLWSLPVEVELYAAYPVLLWLWRQFGLKWVIALVTVTSMSAAAALWLGHQWPMHNFAKYWVIWFAGALLADWVKTRTVPPWCRWYGVAAIAGGAVVMGCRWAGVHVGFEHFVWGAIYFLLMLWAANHPTAPARMPGWLRRATGFLGQISYSLYLVHYPIFLVLGAWWVAAFGQKPVSVFVPLIAALIPIPAAFVLWRLVERPSQSLGRQSTHLPQGSLAASKVAVG